MIGETAVSGAWRHALELGRAATERVTDAVGGPARRQAITLLALVLALDAADKGAVDAVAFQLERSLHIGNVDVGLMVTVSSLVGALGTIPMGALVDRVNRVRLLWVSVILWAVAEVAAGLSPSFPVLLGARVALGLVVAVAGPAVASLTGDLFPPRDRGRIWGFILTGEVLGTGVGLLYAGLLGGAISWRAAFLALAIPSLGVAWLLRRMLPEPARGGQSRLEVGAEEIPSEDDVPETPVGDVEADPHRPEGPVAQIIEDRGIPPASVVLDREPTELNLFQTIAYVLRVRTNLVLIIASSLGYFFLSGLQTFAIIFLRGHFGIGHGVALVLVLFVGAGIVVGLIVAGRIGDAFIRRGRIEARIVIAVVGFAVAAVALVPGILSTSLFISTPLFVVAGIALASPNPGLDAARLDVVPAGMWGRSEGVRTFLRQSLQAFAPLVFGAVSQAFGSPSSGFGAGVNASHAQVSAAQTHGLELTFLVMLLPLVAAVFVLPLALKHYPVNVASALESDRRIARRREEVRQDGEDTEAT